MLRSSKRERKKCLRRHFQGKVKHEIGVTEKGFVMEQIENNKNNTNSLWKTIRLCKPNKSQTQRI